MSRALKGVDGIGKVDIKAGPDGFTVHYDSKKVKPDAIVAALHAGGEKRAKVVNE